MGIEDICIEFPSDTAEVAGYQSSRLDRENQLDSPSIWVASCLVVVMVPTVARLPQIKDLQLKYLEPPQLGVTFQVVGHIFTPVMKIGKIGLIVGE